MVFLYFLTASFLFLIRSSASGFLFLFQRTDVLLLRFKNVHIFEGMIRFINAVSYFFDTFQQRLLSPELFIMLKHFYV